MEKKLNIWAYVKWLWRFSPITWLIMISVFIIVLTGIIYTALCALLAGSLVIVAWAVSFSIYALWLEFGYDIKEHARDWWGEGPWKRN